MFGVCGKEMGLGLEDGGIAICVEVEPAGTPLVGGWCWCLLGELATVAVDEGVVVHDYH